MNQTNERQVIVVGAGPTGLMLACELRLMGADILVLERRPHGTTGESRAPGINARTMEIFKMRGIAKQFRDKGRSVPFVVFAGIPINPKAIDPDWTDGLILPQHETESILARRAKSLGVDIEWSSAVLGGNQTSNSVEIIVKHAGAISSRHAKYVVGCDGGHSAIRKAVGGSFKGSDPLSHWLVGDVQLESPPEDNQSFGRNEKIGTYQVSRTEEDCFRVSLMRVSPPKDRNAKVTLEEFREAMIEGIGTDFGLSSARWLSRFNDGFRQVEQYRYGRALLVGDAAHTHAPIGGQGLNLGIQDAVNLGWKLGLVAQGLATDYLLDSYHEERHPVATNVLKLAKAQTALIKPNEQVDELRDVFSDLLSNEVSIMSIARRVGGISVKYSWGQGHSLVGQRMPDLPITIEAENTTLYKLMENADPILLTLDDTEWPATSNSLPLLKCVKAKLLTQFNSSKWKLPAIDEVPAFSSVLIRPDGIVA